MTIETLYAIIIDRIRRRPDGSYVAGLVSSGTDRVIQKVGEEAVEVVIASKNAERTRTVSEIADLVFHLTVLMAVSDITPADIASELEKRNAASPDSTVG